MRAVRLTTMLVLAAAGLSAQWPSPKSAADAYQFAQGQRDEARRLFGKDDAKAIAILTDALAYLDQPLLKDLAAGNLSLESRRFNIHYDLAQLYAGQGNKPEALRQLTRLAALLQNSSIAKAIEGDKAFDSLRTDPAYQAILAGQRRFERLWESDALNTPYRDNLPDTEKLAGLAKFWSEIKYNFGYPEKLVELDWDKVYLDTMPKVLATKSTAAYYRELMRLCARLSDGHTNVYSPDQVDDSGKPPLRTGLIEGRVMILDGRSPSLEARGVRAGVEILEVDGVPVLDYVRREIEPFQSASTPHDRDTRSYWYAFLRGPAAKPVRLKLRDAAGKDFEQELARRGYSDVRRIPPFEWRMLPDIRIAYVALNDFSNNEVPKLWMAAFPQISTASGIILDLRLNGGGSSNIGYEVIRSLVDRSVPSSRQVMRRYNPTDRARGTLIDWSVLPAGEIEPRQGPRYSGPVVVLSSAATYSAAEDFLVAWKSSARGKVIGEPSGGSTGQPLFFRLPGGGSARVCTKRDTFADGSEWVGKGIDPDILVRPTLTDVRSGRDTVLERAVEFLKSGK